MKQKTFTFFPIFLLIGFIGIIGFSSFVASEESNYHTYCVISGNPIMNIFHCHPRADGQGDECSPDGFGALCSGVYVKYE